MLKLLLSSSHSSASRLVSTSGLLVLISGVAFAQTNTRRIAGSTDQNSGAFSSTTPLAKRLGEERTATIAKTGSEMDDKLRTLEEELREQAKRLDEMRALIADQQRVITALAAKATSGEPKPGEQKDVATTATVTTPQNQTPTLEDRVKKVENKVLAVGPFRLSGDFRLRFDGIFRKADPTPPAGFAPLTHQQNARMRYRLRLNLDTDVDSKLSFHSQLATGPANNSLTMDQDFGETTTRHPFFINEAWIDFHPNKATQLQGGRVQEIFADNSRFLFDDDCP